MKQSDAKDGGAGGRCVSSTDGQAWQFDEGDTPVTAVVIGQEAPRGGSQEERVTLGGTVRADLLRWWSGLQRLNLWNVADLDALLDEVPGQGWPAGLRVLDLRACDLSSLPDLPDSLEELDVAFCDDLIRLPRSVPSDLERLYFDHCPSLKARSLENFLEELKEQNAPLVEMSGSHCPGLTSLAVVPGKVLRKLVLEGCKNLAKLNGIETFSQLDHLNLRGCTALSELPDLPDSVSYALLYGCDQLTTFFHQSIGAYERGVTEDRNVAPILYARKKFGDEVVLAPSAKLLFMGSGRVGKTTLSKRLRWTEMSIAQRLENPELKPRSDEQFTKEVAYSMWTTGFKFEEDRAAEIAAQCEGHGVEIRQHRAGGTTGSLRLWDFGGQEIYHRTHRIFAGFGSVFVLVWRQDQESEEVLLQSMPENVRLTKAEWLAWNRRHSLTYWLEYIFQMVADARVAVVCTGIEKGGSCSPWRDRAKRFCELNPDRAANISSFAIESVEHADVDYEPEGDYHDYHALVQCIKTMAGKVASDIAPVIPRFFQRVIDGIEELKAENDKALAATPPQELKHLIIAWRDWDGWMRNVDSEVSLDDVDVEAISGYLHDAGHIVRVGQRQGEAAVILDQRWATRLIYCLFDMESDLFARIRERHGWFYRSVLEASTVWQSVDDEWEKDRLIDHMTDCGLIVEVAQHGRDNKDTLFLTTETWLLPERRVIQQSLNRRLDAFADRSRREVFRFEDWDVSEFEWRALISFLGGRFGEDAVYYRNGLYVDIRGDRFGKEGVFCLNWKPRTEEAFVGKLDGLLVGPEEQISVWGELLEDLLVEDGSPFARRSRPGRRMADPGDLQHFTLPTGMAEVGISSSGGNKELARNLMEALQGEGISVVSYLDERQDWLQDHEIKPEGVLPLMERLCETPVIIYLLSDEFFGVDPTVDWYCTWELADGAIKLGTGQRSREKTLVCYVTGGSLNSKTVDEVMLDRFQKYGEHWLKKYAEAGLDIGSNRDDWLRISEKFRTALTEGNAGKFARAKGTRGSYERIATHSETKGDLSYDFSEMVDAVKNALGHG